jgi:hypothetical protein
LTDGAPGSPTVFKDPGRGGHPSVTAILNLSESRKSKLQGRNNLIGARCAVCEAVKQVRA